MSRVLDVFYRNAVVWLVVVAALGAVCVWVGQGSAAALLFMILGMLLILWDAHTDPHIPEAPAII